MSKKTVGVFVLAITGALVGFDVYLNWDGIPGNTYSERFREWGSRYRWVAFMISAALGALATHWFSRTPKQDELATAITKRGFKETLRRRGPVILGVFIATTLGMLAGLFW